MGRAKKPFKVGPWVKALWDGEKKRHGIEGKPDMSHVTEGLARALTVNPKTKDGRAEMRQTLKDWAAIAGTDITDRTARNWIGGAWTEDAAAMAVVRAASLPSEYLLREAERRAERRAMNTSKAQYQLAFELCVLGRFDGGERAELLAKAMFEISGLSNDALRSLTGFLRTCNLDIPGAREADALSASEIVADIHLQLEKLDEWAEQTDAAKGIDTRPFKN